MAEKTERALRLENEPLDRAFDRYSGKNTLGFNLARRTNHAVSRRAELLKNPQYVAVLEKYR